MKRFNFVYFFVLFFLSIMIIENVEGACNVTESNFIGNSSYQESANAYYINVSDCNVTFRSNVGSSFSNVFFLFRVENASGQNLSFKWIGTTNDVVNFTIPHTTIDNGSSWNLVDSYLFNKTTHNLSFNQVISSNSQIISSEQIFFHSQVVNRTNSLIGNPYVTITNFSSYYNNTIYIYTITNSAIPISQKKSIFIITGQHFEEVVGQYSVQGIIDSLLSDNIALLNTYEFVIVPEFNVDFKLYTYYYNTEFTSEGNINRHWVNDLGWRTKETNYFINYINDYISNRNNISLFLDYHGTKGNKGYAPAGTGFVLVMPYNYTTDRLFYNKNLNLFSNLIDKNNIYNNSGSTISTERNTSMNYITTVSSNKLISSTLEPDFTNTTTNITLMKLNGKTDLETIHYFLNNINIPINKYDVSSDPDILFHLTYDLDDFYPNYDSINSGNISTLYGYYNYNALTFKIGKPTMVINPFNNGSYMKYLNKSTLIKYDTNTVIFNNASWSMSAWLYDNNSVNHSSKIIVYWFASATSRGIKWSIGTNGKTMEVLLSQNGTNYSTYNTVKDVLALDNKWHLYTLSFNGSNKSISLYRDNVLIEKVTVVYSEIYRSISTLYMNGLDTSASYDSVDYVDDFIFWNKSMDLNKLTKVYYSYIKGCSNLTTNVTIPYTTENPSCFYNGGTSSIVVNFSSYSIISPNNDIKNSSNNVILSSNVDNFSLTLTPNQQIEVGDFTCSEGYTWSLVYGRCIKDIGNTPNPNDCRDTLGLGNALAFVGIIGILLIIYPIIQIVRKTKKGLNVMREITDIFLVVLATFIMGLVCTVIVNMMVSC